ncbi:MAG: YeeE/YedE family protein [Myxococcales bacterium]|nr:YeeE/YedE family protein [Myxococcales bacterium]
METKYMNPYLAGFFLGLVLLTTVFITGRGLGASGAVKSAVVATMTAVAPEHASNSLFYQRATARKNAPLKTWLVFEMLGVLLGAFLSGVISDRLTFETEHPPQVRTRTRLIAAFSGGLLFGLGSMIARGCTSGAALSGMAVFSAGGFLTMLAIFGSAYAVAFFFRKLWV